MRFLLENTEFVSDKIVTIFTLIALGVFFVLLVFFLFLDYKNIKSMEIRRMMYKNMQKLQKYEVTTVYSDKAKNYSGTEILPEPTKSPTAEHSFIFVGWDKNYINESGDTVAKAVFVKRVNTFIVNFYDDDKTTLLKTEEVKYGEGVDTSSFEPTKAETKEFSFKFLCWSKDPSCIKSDESLYAVYDAYPKKYTYTFLDGDGETILSQKSGIFGSKIRAIPAPECKDENFEFSHFDGYREDMILEKNEVFIAVYVSKNGDGTLLYTPNRAFAESLLMENNEQVDKKDYSTITSEDIISSSEGVESDFDKNQINFDSMNYEDSSDVLIDKTSLLKNLDNENFEDETSDDVNSYQDETSKVNGEILDNQLAEAGEQSNKFSAESVSNESETQVDESENQLQAQSQMNQTSFGESQMPVSSDNIYYNNIEMLERNRKNAEFVASQNAMGYFDEKQASSSKLVDQYFEDKKDGVFVEKIEGENEFVDDNFISPSICSSEADSDESNMAIRQDMVVAVPEKKQEMSDLEKAIKKPKQQTITTKKDGVVISINVGEPNIKSRLKKDSYEEQYQAERKMNSRMMFQQNFSLEKLERNAQLNKEAEKEEEEEEIKKDEGDFMRKISVFATQRRTENARNFSYNKPAKHYNAINFNDSKGSSVPNSVGGKVEHKISGEELDNELDNPKYQNNQTASKKRFSSISINTITSKNADNDETDK